MHGALNPENLGDYIDDKDIKKKFNECENRIFQCLWKGTDELVTRSKFPQRSILYIEITYNDTVYNDLPDFVEENQELKKKATALGASPFEFERLVSIIRKRENKIIKIRVKGCPEISAEITRLISSVNSKEKPKLIEEIVD